MQSSNELGNIVQSLPVDLSKPDELIQKMKVAQEKGATSHVIGNLIQTGDLVTINGLSYRVDFADYVKGRFEVKLHLRKQDK